MLGGVTIDLFNHDSATNTDALITTTQTTAANGTYSFTGLTPLLAGHSYLVQEELPSGAIWTVGSSGYSVAATSGNDTTGEVFDNFYKFSISGTKYTDLTGDGKTADDTVLGGVTIDLFNHDSATNTDALITTQMTAANGTYSFTGLTPLLAGHSYLVQEELPSGAIETVGSSGYSVAATSGNDTTGEVFDNFYKFSIKGFKYTDVLGNDGTAGITLSGSGGDDTALVGIKINLFDHNSLTNTDSKVATVTTLADGSYSFTGLGPLATGHTYVVQEEKPVGDTETFGSAGYWITPTSGVDVTDKDFANFVDFGIKGFKYTDVLGNDATAGITLSGSGGDDTPLVGIKIDLFDHDHLTNTDSKVATVTTLADGSYSFTDLGPLAAGHTYVVQEEKPSGDTETFGSAACPRSLRPAATRPVERTSPTS